MDPSHRYSFLDLYRGLIVLFMLEGHLVRQLMGLTWQDGPWFRAHEVFHGLTAPGFLFGAGFTFAIATQRKAHQLRGWSWSFLRRLWRGILLVIIGYTLHLPFLSLTKTISESKPADWTAWLQFDVLQLVGFSLVALRLLYLVSRDDRRFLALVVILGLLTVVAAPLVWASESVRTGAVWWSTALTGAHGSPFPLFPNLAFVLAGVVASWGFLRAREAEAERSYMRRLLWLGLGMIVAGWLLDLAPWADYGHGGCWETSPSFFWIRVGLLLVGMGGLWFVENRSVGSSIERYVMPRWLTTLGVESLFVYIFHLLILYGSVLNPSWNLSAWLGRELTPVMAAVWVVPFVVVSAVGARWWHHAKRRHVPWIQFVYWWMGLSVAGEFFLRAY